MTTLSTLRRSRGALLATLLVAGLALGAAGREARGAESAPRVRVTTNMGTFVVELNPERAPLTVANFLRYVDEGFYSGTLFHRVVGNFVIQGGGHAAADYRLKPTHGTIPNESGNGLRNVRGAVGFARADPPHSGNSQFYVDLAENAELDPLPTRWGYAVFGSVIEGMDVVDRIGAVATGSVGPFKSEAPLKPVIIEKVERVGSAAATAPVTPPKETPAPEPAPAPTSDAAAPASPLSSSSSPAEPQG